MRYTEATCLYVNKRGWASLYECLEIYNKRDAYWLSSKEKAPNNGFNPYRFEIVESLLRASIDTIQKQDDGNKTYDKVQK